MGVLKKLKASRLVKSDIDETSGVDHPAHLAEGFIVMKSLTRNTVDDVVKALTDEETDMSNETENVQPDEVEVLKAKVAELEEELTKAQAEEVSEDEQLIKELPETVRKMIAEERAETNRLTDELRKERDRRLDNEFIQTVTKSMGQLAVNADELGPALRKLSELDEDIFKSVESALKAASGQLDSADIYRQVAKANEVASDSPEGKLEALAKSLIEKDGISYAEAIVKAAGENPHLYSEYRAG